MSVLDRTKSRLSLNWRGRRKPEGDAPDEGVSADDREVSVAKRPSIQRVKQTRQIPSRFGTVEVSEKKRRINPTINQPAEKANAEAAAMAFIVPPVDEAPMIEEALSPEQPAQVERAASAEAEVPSSPKSASEEGSKKPRRQKIRQQIREKIAQQTGKPLGSLTAKGGRQAQIVAEKSPVDVVPARRRGRPPKIVKPIGDDAAMAITPVADEVPSPQKTEADNLVVANSATAPGTEIMPRTKIPTIHGEWQTGTGLFGKLEIALVKYRAELAAGGNCWISVVSQDGEAIKLELPAFSIFAAKVRSLAMQHNARVIMIATPSETIILHPFEGLMTIAHEPHD